jgi:hypothetical protein
MTLSLLRVRPRVEYTVRAWAWETAATAPKGATIARVWQGAARLTSGSSGFAPFDEVRTRYDHGDDGDKFERATRAARQCTREFGN